MSIAIIIGIAAAAEGAAAIAKVYTNRAQDALTHKLFKYEQRRKRRQRAKREFI